MIDNTGMIHRIVTGVFPGIFLRETGRSVGSHEALYVVRSARRGLTSRMISIIFSDFVGTVGTLKRYSFII
jgi:hypothetical protein